MPYRKSKSTSDRLAFIDSLRGIAALMVVILHVAYIPSPSLKLLPWARRLINAGQTGVILFFIISAFTLCLSAQSRSTCSTPFETRDFYIRRLFRIMPLYLVSIPIAWVRDLIVYNYQRPPLETIWSSLSIVDPGNSRGLVWASWTLGVELLFYLLFPLFFKLCTNLWRTIVTFAASVSINLAQSATLFANRDI